jgi:oligopeptide transport system substrate-binding protein
LKNIQGAYLLSTAPFLRRLPFILLLPLLLFSFSCKENKRPASGKVFRYNEANGITSLDPAFARSQTNIWAVNQLFNGLVQLDSLMLVQPCIARRWEISEDGRRYTFYLRPDVYFHDDPLFPDGKGRQVTAADFVYSFRRIIDPAVASPGAWILNSLENASDPEKAGLLAPDDSTFVIRIGKPFPAFLSLLANMYCSVVPKEVVEHYGKDFRAHPVGTGPFLFKFWKEGEKLVFHRNPRYFETRDGKRLPFIDAVAVSFLNDKQSEFMEFVQKKLDFLNTLDVSYKDELINKKGELNPKYTGKFRLATSPFLNTEYLGFLVDEEVPSVRNSPLRQKALRQAISLGFDRRKMITYLRNNIGTPGVYGITPPGLPSFSENVEGYGYDPVKARQILKEAGFPDGKGLPEIVLSTTDKYVDLCEYIQSQLSEIGIKIRVEVNQGATHREMVARQQLAFFRGSWIADYPDAENYFSLFYSRNFAPGGPNTTRFRNSRFDSLYERSVTESDTLIRFSLYRQMDKILIEEAPVVILYYDKVLHLYQNNLSGISPNPMNLLTLKTVRLNDR